MNINVKILETFETLENEENQSEYEINSKKTRDFICVYDFYCLNNMKITIKIKQIPYYTHYYDVFTEYSSLKVAQLSQKILDYYQVLGEENSQKHILLRYNSNNFIKFDDFIFNLPTPKLLIYHIIDTYEKILNSFIKLHNNNICYFNFSLKNVIFDKNFTPILKSFDLSLIKDDLNIQYFLKILDKISDYTYKPLEIHVIFYLIKNEENTLSFNSIELISRNFVNNMSILSLFSKNYKESYLNSCIEFLKKYINQPKLTIIEDIMQYFDKWDNYSLSILYLHLFGNITRCFSLSDNFISKFTIMLTKNICPDPSKRETLENTMYSYKALYNNFTDWTFTKQITNEKMEILFDILKK